MNRNGFTLLYEKWYSEYEDMVNRLASRGAGCSDKAIVDGGMSEETPWYLSARRLGVEKDVWSRFLKDLKEVMDVSDDVDRAKVADAFCTKWKDHLILLKRQERFTEELLRTSANVTRADSVDHVHKTVSEIRLQKIDYGVEADVVNHLMISMQYETTKLKKRIGGFV